MDPGEETLGGTSTLLSHSSKKKEIMWNSKKKGGSRKGYIKYIAFIEPRKTLICKKIHVKINSSQKQSKSGKTVTTARS